MSTVLYPSLYQINTRVWLTALSRSIGRQTTLDDVPDAELDRLAGMGFDWIWLLSVWQTGPGSQRVSRSNPEWRREFEETLHDLSEEDIPGSGFAITDYGVHSALGGDPALARLRERMRERGLKLMLDFVPNHMGLDHPWIESHPDFFIPGSDDNLAHEPHNFVRLENGKVFAYGRDPYFSGWPDTLQLNYANPALQDAMIGELLRMAGQCDGLRCDMAMLVLPDVFERTWGRRAELFWPKATSRVREVHSGFCFMAEVYWDLEWTLQQQGFDYTYDKRLYDRLREGHARPVREHFLAGLDFQDRMARFLENHDEPRAAAAFSIEMHRAAAVLTFLSPGLRFFHQGEFEGKRKRISPHLGRGPEETADQEINVFYRSLLRILRRDVVREGRWQPLECTPAWDGNWTVDCMIGFGWEHPDGERLLVAVNYAANQTQCRIRLPSSSIEGRTLLFTDQLSDDMYERDASELQSTGLFLDLAPWQACAFSIASKA